MSADQDIERVVGVLAGIIPPNSPLHEPEFAGNEWDYVKECLDTGWVSTAGEYVDRLEEALCAFTGAGHAIATVNGTAALHSCLLLAGVEAGDEVIVPALTFVATANAVAYIGARPHFADSEENTLGLDAARLDKHLDEVTENKNGVRVNRKTGRRISAIICMHTFGHPSDLDALGEICRRYSLPLIEDAAESLGSHYQGRHTGNDGLLSALSFNGNKIVTTGGGGAILTNDADLAERARHLTTTARTPHPWEIIHDQVAFNYRMPNLNAALGCAQMEQLPRFLEQKRRLAGRYREAFADLDGVSFFDEPEDCRSNYWINALMVNPDAAPLRDAILKAANDAGFGCRPSWRPMHRLDMYRDCERMNLDAAEDIHRRLINIPSSPRLADSIPDGA